MISPLKKYINRHVFPAVIKETGVVEAYNIWADNYDMQPGNLMLDLDEIIFNGLLNSIDVTGKQIADIGCGTGRHWENILQKEPAGLIGFDVSPGMVKKLKDKYPEANAKVITDNHYPNISDNSFDIIVSTLTIAHIENIEEALNAWSRIMKAKGEMIITDFHPTALATGGQRTFKHGGNHVVVKNFVHPIALIKCLLLKAGFELINEREIKIDETVKHYYSAQNALHVYEKFKGSPIIYGLHFRRGQ